MSRPLFALCALVLPLLISPAQAQEAEAANAPQESAAIPQAEVSPNARPTTSTPSEAATPEPGWHSRSRIEVSLSGGFLLFDESFSNRIVIALPYAGLYSTGLSIGYHDQSGVQVGLGYASRGQLGSETMEVQRILCLSGGYGFRLANDRFEPFLGATAGLFLQSENFSPGEPVIASLGAHAGLRYLVGDAASVQLKIAPQRLFQVGGDETLNLLELSTGIGVLF